MGAQLAEPERRKGQFRSKFNELIRGIQSWHATYFNWAGGESCMSERNECVIGILNVYSS